MTPTVYISGAVEGPTDERALRRLVQLRGGQVHRVQVLDGKPGLLPDAKSALLAVVARSRRPALREDMIPRPGSGRRVGPAYASRLMEFIADSQEGWRPEVAARQSPSLSRCLARLDELIAGFAADLNAC